MKNYILENQICDLKTDMAFIIDTSGSVEQIYERQINWTIRLIDELPIDQQNVRLAVIQYAKYPTTEFSLGTYISSKNIKKHLSKIKFQSGVTRTGYALRKVETELFDERKGARYKRK